MDDINLCKDILRSDLRNALLLHDDTRAWHYGIDLSDKDNPNSLSQYLKLTKVQYEDLLEISGLGRKVKYRNKNRFKMLFGEWVQFLVSIGMHPGVNQVVNNRYFDKTWVGCIEKKNRYWLLLGDINQTELVRKLSAAKRSSHTKNNVTAFNPNTQFVMYGNPPRVNGQQIKEIKQIQQSIHDFAKTTQIGLAPQNILIEQHLIQ